MWVNNGRKCACCMVQGRNTASMLSVANGPAVRSRSWAPIMTQGGTDTAPMAGVVQLRVLRLQLVGPKVAGRITPRGYLHLISMA